MRSNLLKSLVAFSLITSPTIAVAQNASEDVEDSTDESISTVAAGAFLSVVIAILLLVGFSESKDSETVLPPVSP